MAAGKRGAPKGKDPQFKGALGNSGDAQFLRGKGSAGIKPSTTKTNIRRYPNAGPRGAG